MTTVLNRKFDVLARSGTCPPYLLDVLSLLVAHANDTELYKTEMRSAPFPDGAKYEQTGRLVQSHTQVVDEGELMEAVKASHETILLSAEHSLRNYAEELKRVNSIAVATSAKELRELRTTTRQEMDEFRDRLCETAVQQSTRDLQVLRAEWLEDAKADAERLKNDIDLVVSRVERAIEEKTTDYAAFVAQAHEVLNAQPAVDAHAAMTASYLAAEQVSILSEVAAPKAEVEWVTDRLKQAERTIARMSATLYDDAGSNEHSRRTGIAATGATPAHSTPLRRRAGDGSDASAKGGSPMVSLPISTGGTAAPARGEPARTSPPPSGAESEVPISSLGVWVRADSTGDGVAIASVQAGSPGEAVGLEEGFIVSHIGRTAVHTPQEMQRAIEIASASKGNGSVRLTVYDPDAGRVRVVTLNT